MDNPATGAGTEWGAETGERVGDVVKDTVRCWKRSEVGDNPK